jgi:hypothetical protein
MANIKTNTNQSDIINRKSWDEAQWLSFFQDRLSKMKSKREPYENLWEVADSTRSSASFYDNS